MRAGSGGGSSAGLRGGSRVRARPTTRSWTSTLPAGHVADRRVDQAEEVPLDPVAGEIVRDADDERVVRGIEAGGFAEPGAVRRVVEGPSEPTGDFAPQALRSQLDLVLHPAANSSLVTTDGQHNSGPPRGKIRPNCRDISIATISLHRCGKRWGKLRSRAFLRRRRLWTKRWTGRRLYWPLASPASGDFSAPTPSKREAHLSAKRPPPQAQARLSCPHGDPRRPRDPEAPPREGPREPLRVAARPGRSRPLSCTREAREPPVPVAGLRRRLPPGAVGVVALSRPLLVSPGGGRPRRASASRCPAPSGAPSSATGSSGSCARSGRSGSSGCPPATTTC